MKCVRGFVVSPWRRDHFEDLGIDGKIILKCSLQKGGVRAQTGFIWLTV
jgi:hypothetical protein